MKNYKKVPDEIIELAYSEAVFKGKIKIDKVKTKYKDKVKTKVDKLIVKKEKKDKLKADKDNDKKDNDKKNKKGI